MKLPTDGSCRRRRRRRPRRRRGRRCTADATYTGRRRSRPTFIEEKWVPISRPEVRPLPEKKVNNSKKIARLRSWRTRGERKTRLDFAFFFPPLLLLLPRLFSPSRLLAFFSRGFFYETGHVTRDGWALN